MKKMKIKKILTKINHTAKKRQNSDIKYIVVHYVGALGGAEDNAKFYQAAYRGASADFFVGHNGEIVQGNDCFNFYSWHCGGGRQSSIGGTYFGVCTNSNSIGIELCVRKGSTKTMNATDTDWYFTDETLNAAASLVRSLMEELDIPAENVIRHFDVTGKYCPNPLLDIYHPGAWGEFKKMISGQKTEEKVAEEYFVRMSFDDETSQLGAYHVLQNAKNVCKPGYSVYDKTGNAVYTREKSGTQATELKGMSEADVVKKIGPLFTADQKKSGILACISMAQFILESGYCQTELAQRANNVFGMKKNLSGNAWKGSAWDGKSTYIKRTQEEYRIGHPVTITAEFRAYACIEDSIADHSAYLLGATNGASLRYYGLAGEKNYKKAAKIIKNGGYATDSRYVEKLCGIIERWKLWQYNANGETQKENQAKKESEKNFAVRVMTKNLRIRKGPSTRYEAVGCIQPGVYTIVETKAGAGSESGWGRLKSGSGWISLDYVNKI